MAYYPDESSSLRFEKIAALVRGIAEQNFIMKSQIPRVESTTDWKQTFYRESIKTFANITSGTAARTPQGIPRLAAFPEDEVLWEKITAREIKFGAQGTISLEDALTSVVDVEKRTSMRIGNRIANMVDTHIYNTVSENGTASNIYSYTAYSPFDNPYLPSRRPAEDISGAKAKIANSALQSYRADTLVINPVDAAYVASSDAVLTSFDANGPTVMGTGVIGRLWGLNVIETPTNTVNTALVLQARICAAYQQVQDLTTKVIEDPGKSRTIRSWEIGVAQLTDPKSVCLITGA